MTAGVKCLERLMEPLLSSQLLTKLSFGLKPINQELIDLYVMSSAAIIKKMKMEFLDTGSSQIDWLLLNMVKCSKTCPNHPRKAGI